MAIGKGKRVSQAEEEHVQTQKAEPCCTLEAQTIQFNRVPHTA